MRPSLRPSCPPPTSEKERADPFAIEVAGGIVTAAGVGKEIREVVPQTELRVVAVGVLKTLDRRERFDALQQRLEAIDAFGLR